jgi:hypothetical protein
LTTAQVVKENSWTEVLHCWLSDGNIPS